MENIDLERKNHHYDAMHYRESVEYYLETEKIKKVTDNYIKEIRQKENQLLCAALVKNGIYNPERLYILHDLDDKHYFAKKDGEVIFLYTCTYQTKINQLSDFQTFGRVEIKVSEIPPSENIFEKCRNLM